MSDEIFVHLVKKYNLPALIDENSAVGKTVRALDIGGHNSLVVLTDNTAVFYENEVDQYDDGLISSNRLKEPNWPYILNLRIIHDKETQQALEMEYLTLSRKQESEQLAVREKPNMNA